MTPADIARMREMIADGHATEDAAWFVDNCSTLLESLTAALDEVERLRTVADAAGKLVEVQRRAAKAFRTGFEGMPELVRSSGVHRMLADEMAAAGKKLQRAVDDLAGRVS